MYYEILPYKNSRFAKYVLASLLNCIARTQIFTIEKLRVKSFAIVIVVTYFIGSIHLLKKQRWWKL